MVAKLQEFPGWPIYKIKLGTPHDVQIVRQLREHTDAVFRVDANTAWTAEQTIHRARDLADLGVEFIEQAEQARDVFGRSTMNDVQIQGHHHRAVQYGGGATDHDQLDFGFQ